MIFEPLQMQTRLSHHNNAYQEKYGNQQETRRVSPVDQEFK
jgi:hypothetical protein